MAIVFNAGEVLEMAREIERNGAAFYRKAASLNCGTEADSELLVGLADMEDEHEKTFAAMAVELSDEEKQPTAFDPDDETQMYLNALAAGHGGEGTPAAADGLTGQESMADILGIAIGLEKKSILFYLGMKDMVPERLGKDKIDGVIAEERSHVAQLARQLAALQKP